MTDDDEVKEAPASGPWRVRVEAGFPAGIAVLIGRPYEEGGRQLLLRHEYSYTEEDVPPAQEFPRPSLRLDDQLGRALLAALTEYYGTDIPTLRTDMQGMEERLLEFLDQRLPTGAAILDALRTADRTNARRT